MSDLRPMLATAGELPTGDGWQYEFKWDGVRLILETDGATHRCLTRNLNDITASWPELDGISAALGGRAAVLDGEIVVMNEHGRPDFGLLQRRLHVNDRAAAARLASTLPATLLVFDLLEFDGHDLRVLPLSSRREVLEQLELDGPSWKVPPVVVGDGPATLDAASQLGLEGVVAKRRNSTYVAGSRSDAWRKIKLMSRDQFVVVGFTRGSGRRESGFGALVLGVKMGSQWRCVGSVGTGFDDRTITELSEVLRAHERDQPVWTLGPNRPDAIAVEPTLVCEVAYSGWTRDGVLRHPAYVGLSTDRQGEDVGAPDGAPWSEHDSTDTDTAI